MTDKIKQVVSIETIMRLDSMTFNRREMCEGPDGYHAYVTYTKDGRLIVRIARP